ncbi:hypothetical protein PG993_004370 [Apiospora rasikravindrae]|uniref:Uncharacterized protein n=1 Tax=Apiospora rasikravindrae TaxID=990691 RepID=A0ABR1TEC0_9PEZI
MWLAPTDLPRLQLCEVCSSLFTGKIDQSTGEDVQRSIWHKKIEHTFTRTRGEIERAAISGCAFCEQVFQDTHYAETLENGRIPQPDAHEKQLRCHLENKRRPTWFLLLDEELQIRIRYNRYLEIIYEEQLSTARSLYGGKFWSLTFCYIDSITQEVAGGELVIRGHLQPVRVIRGAIFQSPLLDEYGHEYEFSEFHDDEIPVPPVDACAARGQHIEAWCLLLMDSPGGSARYGTRSPRSNWCKTMVLVKTDNGKGHLYKRIGTASADAKQPPTGGRLAAKQRLQLYRLTGFAIDLSFRLLGFLTT